MRRCLLALALVGALGGCSTLQTEAHRAYGTKSSMGPESVAFTTADVRVVYRHTRPPLDPTKPPEVVTCTEPGPDVAKALAASMSLTGQGGNGTVTANAALSASSAEAAKELAGRSTELLALRAGVFAACEAYANGAIGKDGYALALSRYGQLMTTLFLAHDIVSAASAASDSAAFSAPAPPLTGAATTGGSTQPPAANTPNTPAPAGNNSAPAPTAPAAKQTASTPRRWRSPPTPGPVLTPAALTSLVYAPTDGERRRLLHSVAAGNPAPSAAAAPAASPANPSAGSPSPGGSGTTTSPGSGQSPASGGTSSSGGGSAAAALALARMNEDYLNQGMLDALFIACINKGDPSINLSDSRPGPPEPLHWLQQLCYSFVGLPIPYGAPLPPGSPTVPNTLAALFSAEAALHPKAINPEVAVTSQPASSPGPASTGGLTLCAAGPVDAHVSVRAYQAILFNMGDLSQKPDGKYGPNTKQALIKFQTSQKLCPSGVADKLTLVAMKLDVN